MAVLPLPNSETPLGDIAKLKAAVAPLHPYLLPSTLTLTTSAGGLFSSAGNSKDHVTTQVSAPSPMLLSESSISSLLSSVKDTPSSPLQSQENKTSEAERDEVQDDNLISSPVRDSQQDGQCHRYEPRFNHVSFDALPCCGVLLCNRN